MTSESDTEKNVEQVQFDLVRAFGDYLLGVFICADDNVWSLVPPGKSNRDMLQEILRIRISYTNLKSIVSVSLWLLSACSGSRGLGV